MKIISHYNGEYEDTLVIEGNNFEECKKITLEQCAKRGWESKYCWSEIIDDE